MAKEFTPEEMDAAGAEVAPERPKHAQPKSMSQDDQALGLMGGPGTTPTFHQYFDPKGRHAQIEPSPVESKFRAADDKEMAEDAMKGLAFGAVGGIAGKAVGAGIAAKVGASAAPAAGAAAKTAMQSIGDAIKNSTQTAILGALIGQGAGSGVTGAIAGAALPLAAKAAAKVAPSAARGAAAVAPAVGAGTGAAAGGSPAPKAVPQIGLPPELPEGTTGPQSSLHNAVDRLRAQAGNNPRAADLLARMQASKNTPTGTVTQSTGVA